MAKTLQERFIAALTAKGYKRVKETHRYIVFCKDAEFYYYVGRSGSLRVGRTVAHSIPAPKSFKAALLGLPGAI